MVQSIAGKFSNPHIYFYKKAIMAAGSPISGICIPAGCNKLPGLQPQVGENAQPLTFFLKSMRSPSAQLGLFPIPEWSYSSNAKNPMASVFPALRSND